MQGTTWLSSSMNCALGSYFYLHLINPLFVSRSHPNPSQRGFVILRPYATLWSKSGQQTLLDRAGKFSEEIGKYNKMKDLSHSVSCINGDAHVWRLRVCVCSRFVGYHDAIGWVICIFVMILGL